MSRGQATWDEFDNEGSDYTPPSNSDVAQGSLVNHFTTVSSHK